MLKTHLKRDAYCSYKSHFKNALKRCLAAGLILHLSLSSRFLLQTLNDKCRQARDTDTPRLSMWISHQTISSGVRLRETVQSLQNAGRQRCSPLQRGRARPRESGSQAEQLGLSFVPRWKVCVCLSLFVAEVGFTALQNNSWLERAVLVKHKRKLEYSAAQVTHTKRGDLIQD